MHYIARTVAVSLLETKGVSRELLEQKENVELNTMLVKNNFQSEIHKPITEPEMYELVNQIANEISAMLETGLSNKDFDKDILDLVKKCNQEQIQQMYCNMINKQQIIPVIKKESTIDNILFERTLQIYINKLNENNIEFELIHDSICTKDADDELCEQLLSEAEKEASLEIKLLADKNNRLTK